MMVLDLRSIIVMTGLLGLLLAVVMLFLRMSYPRTIRGLGWWSGAGVLAFGATLLFGGRGVIPDLVSIVGANLMLLSGMTLFYFGAQRFFGLPLSWRRWGGVLLAMTPVLVWYTVAAPSFNARVLLVSAVWAWMQLSLALLIWRHGREKFSTRYTVVVLVVHGSVIVLRFLSALLPLPGENLLDPSRVQTLYIAANAMLILALGVGLILMASDRLTEVFEHSASHDSLTNTLIRRALLTACEQELERCRRHDRHLALLMLDIDHFKAINDSRGHQMGDRVLVDFVRRIEGQLRRPDQLGRFGGEEFIVLLPETTLEGAVLVAERIRATVMQQIDGLPAITVSIGVTTNRPDEERVDDLLARADKALYKAKAEGRNRVAAV